MSAKLKCKSQDARPDEQYAATQFKRGASRRVVAFFCLLTRGWGFAWRVHVIRNHQVSRQTFLFTGPAKQEKIKRKI